MEYLQYLQYLSIFLVIVGGLLFLSALFPKNRPDYTEDSRQSSFPKAEELPINRTPIPSFLEPDNLEKVNSNIEIKSSKDSQTREGGIVTVSYDAGSYNISLAEKTNLASKIDQPPIESDDVKKEDSAAVNYSSNSFDASIAEDIIEKVTEKLAEELTEKITAKITRDIAVPISEIEQCDDIEKSDIEDHRVHNLPGGEFELGDDSPLKDEFELGHEAVLKDEFVLRDEPISENELASEDEPISKGEYKLKEKPAPRDELVLSEKVVLYNDNSGLIDYFNKTSILDNTFSRYKNIKRLAEGRAVIEGNGISIRSSKGFFRFGFDAFSKVAFGKNYVAVFIKSSNSVKLFLFGQDVDAIPLLEKAYNSYLTERIR